MQEAIHPKHLTGSRRAQLLAAAALVSVFVVAGCGGSGAHSPTAAPASGPSTPAPSTTTARALTTAVSGGGLAAAALAFSECMRSSGVPNFPDPKPGGGFLFPVSGGNLASPAFRSAQAKCRKLLPGGGPPGPGSTTHPSAQTLAKLVRIAECMREHGISQFPDPRTSVPSNPVGYQEITDFDGAILLFPSTINLQSPAYRQDLDACGAPPLGLHH
jgi:hypothetical protein